MASTSEMCIRDRVLAVDPVALDPAGVSADGHPLGQQDASHRLMADVGGIEDEDFGRIGVHVGHHADEVAIVFVHGADPPRHLRFAAKAPGAIFMARGRAGPQVETLSLIHI